MYKKLLGLLPLVWLAVLAQHLSHPGGSRSMASPTADYGRWGPVLHSPYGVFYKASPRVVPVYLSLDGRSIESVTLDRSFAHLSRPLGGQQVDYCVVPQTTGFQSSTVILTPQGLTRLPTGLQRIRFTMSDHSFVEYNLIVTGTRQPCSPTSSLKDTLRSERNSAEIDDRQNQIRVADGRPTATL